MLHSRFRRPTKEVATSATAPHSAATQISQDERVYRKMLVALLAAGIAAFVELYSFQAMLPQVTRDLSLTPANASLTVSAATLGVAVSVLTWTIIAGKIGRHRAMQTSMACAALLGLATVFVPGFASLLVLRFLTGCFLAGVPVLAVAFIYETLSPLKAAKAAGAYISGATIGGATGRLIAGPLAAMFNWRAALAVVSVVSLIAALVFIVLSNSTRSRAQTSDFNLRIWVRRIAQAIRTPQLVLIYVQSFIVMGTFGALFNYTSFHLEGPSFGIKSTLIPLIFLTYLSGTVSSRFTGNLLVRWGSKGLSTRNYLLAGLGIGLLFTNQLWGIVAGLILYCAGFFSIHATFSAWIGMIANTGNRAEAIALYNIFYYTGSGVIGTAGGFVYALGWTPFVASLLVAIGIAALILLIGAQEVRVNSE